MAEAGTGTGQGEAPPAGQPTQAPEGAAAQVPAAAPVVEETPEQKQARAAREQEEKDKAFKRVLRSKDKWKAEAISARERIRLYEEGKIAGAPKPQAAASAGNGADAEPTRDKFENYEDFVEARAAWRADQRVDKKLNEREEAERKAKLETEEKALRDTWSERLETAHERYPDYTEVTADEDYNPTPTMARAIMESEIGPDISYFLAKNLEEVERIAGLSPVRQIAEIGKLEAKISAIPAAKRASKAPAPITPVEGTAGSVGTEIRPGMKYEDFVKARNKQLGRR